MHLTKKDFIHVLLPPVFVAALFFVSVFGVLLPSCHDRLLSKKKEMIMELTNTTWSVLDHYNSLEKKGLLSRSDAQNRAKETIRAIRYGDENKDYFWINDLSHVMVMHPYRTDLEGKDVSDFVDPTGHLLFQSFVQTVQESKSGYVSYMWQWKDDPSHIVPKLSYVKGFEPWNWVLGTGIYIDDVEADITALTKSLFLFLLFTFCAVLIISFYIVHQGLKMTDRHRKAEKDIRLHRDHLEELVHQKTTDLQQSNDKLAKEIQQRLKAQEQIEKDHSFLSTVIESLPFPFYVTDVKNYRILMANNKACEAGHGQGSTCHELTHGLAEPCSGKDHLCPLQEVKKTGKPCMTEHIHSNMGGEKVFVEVHGYPIFDDDGIVTQMIEFALDITKRKNLEEELRRVSVTDSLTGLLNRHGFMLMANEQLKLSKRTGNKLFLLFADMDKMKSINDTFGHATGDDALIATAGVLNKTLRESDLISRLGGDEFAALLINNQSFETVSAIIARLKENIARSNASSRHPFTLALSYGIIDIEKENSYDLDMLLTKADNLMYEQKRQKER